MLLQFFSPLLLERWTQVAEGATCGRGARHAPKTWTSAASIPRRDITPALGGGELIAFHVMWRVPPAACRPCARAPTECRPPARPVERPPGVTQRRQKREGGAFQFSPKIGTDPRLTNCNHCTVLMHRHAAAPPGTRLQAWDRPDLENNDKYPKRTLQVRAHATQMADRVPRKRTQRRSAGRRGDKRERHEDSQGGASAPICGRTGSSTARWPSRQTSSLRFATRRDAALPLGTRDA